MEKLKNILLMFIIYYILSPVLVKNTLENNIFEEINEKLFTVLLSLNRLIKSEFSIILSMKKRLVIDR